ncbi:MAG: hypothetical protein WCQ99_02735 [Pseudomonadota bacterium]
MSVKLNENKSNHLSNYCGGKTNLQEFLVDGYVVYVSNVGALSSNWDRAIELYYEIKGGQVDFGLEHSRQFGHHRHDFVPLSFRYVH